MNTCDYGCGNEAKFTFKNGKICCEKNISKCPEIKKKNKTNTGGIAWNRGLTKENNESLKKASQTLKNKYKSGEVIHSWLGRRHTKETKLKISKARIKFLEENPDKVPYLINHSSKMSYPEKLLYNKLKELNIDFEYRFQHGIYEYDFAIPEIKLDIEVDGGTHKQEKVKKIDKKRDKWSKFKGWTILRFEAKIVNKKIDFVITKILKTIVDLKNIRISGV